MFLFCSPERLASYNARGQLKLQNLLLKMKKHSSKWHKVMLQREKQKQNMFVLLLFVLHMHTCIQRTYVWCRDLGLWKPTYALWDDKYMCMRRLLETQEGSSHMCVFYVVRCLVELIDCCVWLLRWTMNTTFVDMMMTLCVVLLVVCVVWLDRNMQKLVIRSVSIQRFTSWKGDQVGFIWCPYTCWGKKNAIYKFVYNTLTVRSLTPPHECKFCLFTHWYELSAIQIPGTPTNANFTTWRHPSTSTETH